MAKQKLKPRNRLAAQPASPQSVPIAVSPPASDSSGADDVSNAEGEELYEQIAPRTSPLPLAVSADDIETEDVITCQWEECGVVFTHLPTLIDHIHNGMISHFVLTRGLTTAVLHCRSYWRSQSKLYLRVGILPTSRSTSNLAFCSHLPY